MKVYQGFFAFLLKFRLFQVIIKFTKLFGTLQNNNTCGLRDTGV